MKTIGSFFGKFEVEHIDGRKWRIVNPEGKFYFVLIDGRKCTPRDGELTDFASIPRIFWRILPPVGDGKDAKYGPAAIIHDELYKLHEFDNGVQCSRKTADDVFYAAMRELDVSKWRRDIMYAVVRVGRRKYYHRHDRDVSHRKETCENCCNTHCNHRYRFLGDFCMYQLNPDHV